MRDSGFTVVELLIAVVFMTLLIAIAQEALRQAARETDQVEDALKAELTRALDVIATDLRCATLDNNDPSSVFASRSEDGFHRVDFVRAGGESDDPAFDDTGYVVRAISPGNHELWRRSNDRQKENAANGGLAARLCSGVQTFSVQVFDGDGWKEDWGWNSAENAPAQGIRGLPLVVSVRLGIRKGDHTREERRLVLIYTALLQRALHE